MVPTDVVLPPGGGARILVILGNPLYKGYASLGDAEERDLAEVYRGPALPGLPAPQGQGLNDLYVRFFRMTERRIVNGPPIAASFPSSRTIGG